MQYVEKKCRAVRFEFCHAVKEFHQFVQNIGKRN